jgi:tRNA 2-selenouridine synthase SelU
VAENIWLVTVIFIINNENDLKIVAFLKVCDYLTVFGKKMSDSEEDNVLERIEAAAQEAVSNLIPQKSRVAYETTYSRLEEWRSKQKVNCINEKVMLAYFLEKSKIVKPSTLWSVYSMLRTLISINKNLDLSKYTNLIAFFKRQSEGYRAKKSESFSKENIEKFLTTANDEDYLMHKVKVFLSYKFGYYLFFVFRWF